MSGCRGASVVGGEIRRTATGRDTPVRVDGKHRRLRADAASPLSGIILGLIDGFNGERVEGVGNRLNAANGHPHIASCGLNIGMP